MFQLKNLLFKTYAIFFAWTSLGDLIRLFLPESQPYIYYHIMQAFFQPTHTAYLLAIASAAISLLGAFPLLMIAFDRQRPWRSFFKSILWIRITLDLLGHNYEYQFIKSSFVSNPLTGSLLLGLIVGFTLPSYIAHFRYAFQPDSRETAAA